MIDDVVKMYDYRAEQFYFLRSAILNFDLNKEQEMWECLFNYAQFKAKAAEIFNSFTEEELAVLLCNHGVNVVMSCSYPD